MIIWAPRANRDIREAYFYIAESNERAADRINSAIVEAGEGLVHFPRRGRRSGLRRSRELIVQNTHYILVYRIARNGDVIIQRVMHMARDRPQRR
jgi:toxin ParE1/3/4